MSRRDLVLLLAVYGLCLVGGTAAWVALFHTPLLAGSVFFYRGLSLLVLVAAVVTILLAVLGWGPLRGRLDVRDVLLIVTLLVSGNALFFTHLPVTGERSITVYLLADLGGAGAPLTAEQLAGDLVRVYVVERGAVEKRLEEQLVTGTVVRDGEGYRLTGEGEGLLRLYEVTAGLFAYSPANARP